MSSSVPSVVERRKEPILGQIREHRTDAEKLRIISDIRNLVDGEGITATIAAKRAHVNVSQIYYWQRKFKEAILSGDKTPGLHEAIRPIKIHSPKDQRKTKGKQKRKRRVMDAESMSVFEIAPPRAKTRMLFLTKYVDGNLRVLGRFGEEASL
jgi:hypothetical protein